MTKLGRPHLLKWRTKQALNWLRRLTLPIALGLLEFAEKDVIAFVHNPHLCWDTDKKSFRAS